MTNGAARSLKLVGGEPKRKVGMRRQERYFKKSCRKETESTADETWRVCHALYRVMVNVSEGTFHTHRDGWIEGAWQVWIVGY